MLDAEATFISDDRAEAGSQPPLRLLLASPRGFCAGVRRAIEAVERALERHGAPVYVRRPIVHNRAVVASLEARGAIFVQELDQVPEGAVAIFSAHGVPPEVAAEAEQRRLVTYDAVCPLVAKVHREVARHHRNGRHVLLIGHRGHPEIVGTLGQIPAGDATLIRDAADVPGLDIAADAPLGYAVQTTYAVGEAEQVADAIGARFSDVVGPPSSDICYATTNRQAAVRAIAAKVDALIVVGEHFSSNACRLAEVAAAAGCASVQLVADRSAIDWRSLSGCASVGVTAAASTPEASVEGVVAALRSRFQVSIEEVAAAEEAALFKPVRID